MWPAPISWSFRQDEPSIARNRVRCLAQWCIACRDIPFQSSPDDSTGGATDRSRNNSRGVAEQIGRVGHCVPFLPLGTSRTASARPPWGRFFAPTAPLRMHPKVRRRDLARFGPPPRERPHSDPLCVTFSSVAPMARFGE